MDMEQVNFLACQLAEARLDSLKWKQNSKALKSIINRLKLRRSLQHNSKAFMLSNGNQNPLEICPEEVWELILQYVSNNDDLISSFNVCCLWRNVLLPRRTQFLFQKILPLLEEELDKSDVLNCRKVCRIWRQAIDNHLRYHASHSDFSSSEEDSLNNGRFNANAFRTQINSSNQMERILECIENGETPFFSRGIELKMKPATLELSTTNEYWDNVKRLIYLQGDHIWYCTLTPGAFPPNQMYSQIRECLILMPRLKVLNITLSGPQFFREIQPFVEFIERHPLPELNELIKLSVFNVPSVMLNAFLKKYYFIKKLQVYVPRGDDFDYKQGTNLGNLEEYSTTDDKLSGFDMVQWQLRKLSLSFKRRDFDMEDVFRTVNKFGATLHFLNLNFEYLFSSSGHCGQLSLLLPHLENLKVVSAFGRHFRSLDFILPLTSLKRLHLDYRSCVDDIKSAQQIIQLSGFCNNMYDSNIWRLFPALQEIYMKYAFISTGNGGNGTSTRLLSNKENLYRREEYMKTL